MFNRRIPTAVSHKSFVSLFLFKRNSTLLPGTEVIVWDRLESPLVNVLFMAKLLSLDPLSWDVDCLLTLWPLLIPCSRGDRCCTFGFLIFSTVERNFLYHSLSILTEKSIKHLCSIRAWDPVSFFLSLSPWVGKIPWRQAQQPTPVFLPGESHGQRSLAGCSP